VWKYPKPDGMHLTAHIHLPILLGTNKTYSLVRH
jgi:hypothetical protein